MMEELQSIKLNIANRQYPLRVQRSEEEGIREAAKLINERIKEYEKQFAVKDTQDLLAMASIHFAVEALAAKSRKNENPLSEKLESLDRKLAAYLRGI